MPRGGRLGTTAEPEVVDSSSCGEVASLTLPTLRVDLPAANDPRRRRTPGTPRPQPVPAPRPSPAYASRSDHTGGHRRRTRGATGHSTRCASLVAREISGVNSRRNRPPAPPTLERQARRSDATRQPDRVPRDSGPDEPAAAESALRAGRETRAARTPSPTWRWPIGSGDTGHEESLTTGGTNSPVGDR